MLWFLIIFLYMIFPVIGYVQYRIKKEKGMEPDYTFTKRDLRTRSQVPDSIKLMRTGIWALLITVISIFPLMGLPGGLVIEILHVAGLIPANKLAGEDLWPAALVLSFILPFGWPLAVFVRNLCVGSVKLSPSTIFWAVFLFWVVSLILILAFLM